MEFVVLTLKYDRKTAKKNFTGYIITFCGYYYENKHMKLKIHVTSVVLLFLAASCSRSLDNSNATTVASSGAWRVTLFTDSGNNETTDFSGYAFAFNSSGLITATKSTNTQNGTWSSGSNKFNINLGPKDNTNKPLGELTDDWQIISVSDSEIKLKDDSKAEFLTFTKN